MMNTQWFARENDLIGGWCVVPIDLPPSSGVWTIANFIDERSARHIAWLHNQWLQSRRQNWGGQLAIPDPIDITGKAAVEVDDALSGAPRPVDLTGLKVAADEWYPNE